MPKMPTRVELESAREAMEKAVDAYMASRREYAKSRQRFRRAFNLADRLHAKLVKRAQPSPQLRELMAVSRMLDLLRPSARRR